MEARELHYVSEALHDSIAFELYGRGLGCPLTDDMTFNSEGQVYFTMT
jgi:hypothetical protein